MTSANTRYLAQFAVTLAAILAVIAGINWWVDPYFVFRSDLENSWAKYYSRSGTREGKAELMRKLNYSTLFLGTSRTENGLNPESIWLNGEPAFNAGLPACGIEEAEIVLRYAMDHRTLNRVVIQLDLVLFGNPFAGKAGFEGSRFHPDLNLAQYYAQALVSYSATKYSWRVIENALRDKHSSYTIRGWKHTFEGGSLPPRARFDVIFWGYLQPETGTYRRLQYQPERLEALRRIIQLCRDNDIELTMAFSPIHATLIESIRSVGLWESFERMKRDVTMLANDEWPAAAVWDFAVVSPYTAEPIEPPEGQKFSPYYVEAAHFTGALGDLVLRRTIGDEIPEDFGVRLSPEVIDDHLARARILRDQWAEQNPIEVERLRAMIDGTPPFKLPPIQSTTSPLSRN